MPGSQRASGTSAAAAHGGKPPKVVKQGPGAGLVRPRTAKADRMTEIGRLHDLDLRLGDGTVRTAVGLAGWRVLDLAAHLGTTGQEGWPAAPIMFGAFQAVARPAADAPPGADAALAPLHVAGLPWSYIAGEDARRPELSAIPATEPRAVIARGTAWVVRWEPATRGYPAALASLAASDPRLIRAFQQEVDPTPLRAARRLVILDTLYVHPAARGQSLGLAFLWGVLAGMGFSAGDAVVADPWPIGTPWAPLPTATEPTTAAEMATAMTAIRRLSAYYRALGLTGLPTRIPGLPPEMVLAATAIPGL
ncbi:hypothetical protein [Roseisolibacter agri]|uniref:Uncharacterized protein n=1 Tax=Roseisolibacter agri TaxID=2014610 RepID=A0AA37QLY6_9BACT|nr:hypothetical protein [Roseisolibacter agri]GLC28283.1 hypothetical protein rosag_47960 [Roseisolibacter agri]